MSGLPTTNLQEQIQMLATMYEELRQDYQRMRNELTILTDHVLTWAGPKPSFNRSSTPED